jgi:hypothetical protein
MAAMLTCGRQGKNIGWVETFPSVPPLAIAGQGRLSSPSWRNSGLLAQPGFLSGREREFASSRKLRSICGNES